MDKYRGLLEKALAGEIGQEEGVRPTFYPFG